MERLITLYKQMADITEPECGKSCAVPHSCCSPEYCESTIHYAQEDYGIELQHTGHEKLPLMGPTGCTAAPYLRPMCTMHTCDINGLGFKKNDQPWTKMYFKIRNQIESLEWKRYKQKKGATNA